MIIGIDANEANVEQRVGISEYAYELLMQFEKLQIANCQFHIYLKDKPNENFPKKSKNWQYTVFGPKKFWTQFALPLKLYTQRMKPDVFFSPGHYTPRFSPIPRVISIMDLAFFHFPEYFTKKDLAQLHSWTSYSVKKAKAIIAISKATKSDIINLYHVGDEAIHVIYPGIKSIDSLTPHIYPMKELQNKYGISECFVLFVGTLQPRKNIVRLIEAFSIVVRDQYHVSKKEKEKLQLVVVGKKGWEYEEILQAPKKYGILERVKFLDFVPDEDLALLYQNALCFVWPSLYEGFGLPILEAMKYGCPVITSSVSSLPEAGGDAALYVDPLDVQDIAHKVEKVLSDTKLRADMIEKGKTQVKKFSWEKAAKETLAVLEKVAKKS